MKTNLILALMVLVVACNPVRSGSRTGFKNPVKELQGEALTVDNEYSYQYTVRGCSTGLRTFGSKEELCQGLMNNRLNNDCAFAERNTRFQNDCLDTIGHYWGEAIQCDVIVQKMTDEVVTEKSFCAGPVIGSRETIPEVKGSITYKTSVINVSVKADAGMNFQPSFEYTVVQDGTEMAHDHKPVTQPINWEAPIGTDTEAHLGISCYPSAGCPKN